MTRDELIEKLKGYEWRDIEFKEASFAVPRDVYTTVSAFANTEGGHIVFGVTKRDGAYEIMGVIPASVDDVQNGFLNGLRDPNKLSALIPVEEHKIDDTTGAVLIFYIPEAARKDKPLHLNRDWRESYIRRGGCDQRCSEEEVRRFIRDASDTPYDKEELPDLDPEHCFDDEVLNWYRKIFVEKHPGRYETCSNLEFLNEWGLVIDTRTALVPTRGSVLLFGKDRYVRQLLPRCIVDYQRIDSDFDNWTPELRWNDRVPVEQNLFRAWWLVVEKFMRLSDKPFSLDLATLRRDDQPPDYIAFREAAINLLLHQDFGDLRRTPTLKIFKDRTVFWNPGDAFASTSELLDATEKEVRNPSIVAAFRRIGLSDQAGTGVRTIFKNWRDLGHFPPGINNNKADKTFELTLPRKALISEQQQIFLSTLGVRLSDPEAQVFAFACQKSQIDLTDVRAVTGASVNAARALLERLATQVLLQPLDAEEGIYVLAEHLRERATALLAGSAETANGEPPADEVLRTETGVSRREPLTELSEKQWTTLQFCDVARSLGEIMARIGVTHRGYFTQNTLQPLLEVGLMKRTKPDDPTAADQKYVLAKAGVELLAWKLKQNEADRSQQE